MRIAGVIGSITICAAVTIVAPGLYAQDQKSGSTTAQASTSALTNADIGRVAFNENCAICHGVQGTGLDREPYWNYLSKDIPSLADLSARNGGAFPFARVYETIDGRHEAMARGTRDMPVWGRKFKAESVGLNANYDSDDFARGKILALTEYVYRLQRSAGVSNKTDCQPNKIAFLTGLETPAEYIGLQGDGNSRNNHSCQLPSFNFVREFENPYEETMRAASAGLSMLTGESTNGDAAYLMAYVERPDGSGHPAFGMDEQRLFIYKMPSGKYVVRFIQDPPEKYWPGAH
jgi:mono/diheme cytochrome c family protein